jgi:hypothetical protein
MGGMMLYFRSGCRAVPYFITKGWASGAPHEGVCLSSTQGSKVRAPLIWVKNGPVPNESIGLSYITILVKTIVGIL